MTLSSTATKISHNGNGATVAFAFPYYFLHSADLEVRLVAAGGADSVKALGSDYTVSGAGNPSGGTVTMATAPASGERLVIRRVVALTQTVDYAANDPFPAQTHEDALDRRAMAEQHLQEQLDRAIAAPVQDIAPSLALPRAAARANKALIFDADGDVAVSADDYADQASAASASASAASSSATAASSSASAAATSASEAAASAAAAAGEAGKLSGSSNSSVAIATGAKSFATQAGKAFGAGAWLLIASAADEANYMHGQATAYGGTALTVNVTNFGGAGTFADWVITVSGTRGAVGATGPTGPSGPGSGDMLAANNLGDVADAPTAQANLDLEPGVDVFKQRTIAGTSPVAVANGNGVSGNPTISVDAATTSARGVDYLKPESVAFHAAANALTWTDMPSSDAFLNSAARTVLAKDLTRFTQVRLIVNKPTGTAGASGAKLHLRYRTSFSTTATDYLQIGTSEVSCLIDTSSMVVVSSWTDLDTSAKADVFLAIIGTGGDGAADPTLGSIHAEFR